MHLQMAWLAIAVSSLSTNPVFAQASCNVTTLSVSIEAPDVCPDRLNCPNYSVVTATGPSGFLWSRTFYGSLAVYAYHLVLPDQTHRIAVVRDRGSIAILNCNGVLLDEPSVFSLRCQLQWAIGAARIDPETLEMQVAGVSYPLPRHVFALETNFLEFLQYATSDCQTSLSPHWEAAMDGVSLPHDAIPTERMIISPDGAKVALTTSLNAECSPFDPDSYETPARYEFDFASGNLIAPVWLGELRADGEFLVAEMTDGEEAWKLWMSAPVWLANRIRLNSGGWQGLSIVDSNERLGIPPRYVRVRGDQTIAESVALGTSGTGAPSDWKLRYVDPELIFVQNHNSSKLAVYSNREYTKPQEINTLEFAGPVFIEPHLDNSSMVVAGSGPDGYAKLWKCTYEFDGWNLCMGNVIHRSERSLRWNPDAAIVPAESGIVELAIESENYSQVLSILMASGRRYRAYVGDLSPIPIVHQISFDGPTLRGHGSDGEIVAELDLGGDILHAQQFLDTVAAWVREGDTVEIHFLSAWADLVPLKSVVLSTEGCSLEAPVVAAVLNNGRAVLQSSKEYMIAEASYHQSTATSARMSGTYLTANNTVILDRGLDGFARLVPLPEFPADGGLCSVQLEPVAFWNGSPPILAQEETLSFGRKGTYVGGSGATYALDANYSPLPFQLSIAYALAVQEHLVLLAALPGPEFGDLDLSFSYDPEQLEFSQYVELAGAPTYHTTFSLVAPGQGSLQIHKLTPGDYRTQITNLAYIGFRPTEHAPGGTTDVVAMARVYRQRNHSELPVIPATTSIALPCTISDPDRNGATTIDDVQFVLDALLHGNPDDPSLICRGDFDGDARLTSFDAWNLWQRSLDAQFAPVTPQSSASPVKWSVRSDSGWLEGQRRIELELQALHPLVSGRMEWNLTGASATAFEVAASGRTAVEVANSEIRHSFALEQSPGRAVVFQLELEESTGEFLWLAMQPGHAYGPSGQTSSWGMVRLPLDSIDRAANEVYPLALLPPTPNPFNPSTTIECTLPVAGDTRVSIVDVRGRLVCTLFSGQLQAGAHRFTWRGGDQSGQPVSSGVYFCRLSAAGGDRTQRLVLAR